MKGGHPFLVVSLLLHVGLCLCPLQQPCCVLGWVPVSVGAGGRSPESLGEKVLCSRVGLTLIFMILIYTALTVEHMPAVLLCT